LLLLLIVNQSLLAIHLNSPTVGSEKEPEEGSVSVHTITELEIYEARKQYSNERICKA
jgi:hypothetical protein